MSNKTPNLPNLLPCPNCKKVAVYYITSADMEESVIQCACCPLSMRSLYNTEEELGNMWNNMPRFVPTPISDHTEHTIDDMDKLIGIICEKIS